MYQVSNLGRVKSLKRIIKRKNGTELKVNEKILKTVCKSLNCNTLPREYVQLSKNSKPFTFLVHRLVAVAFIPNPNGYEQVNHIDENPLNNRVENLEWCNNEYNHNYGTRNQRQAVKLFKKVSVYDLNNNYITTYNSIKEAAKSLNCDESSITKVCKNKCKYTHNYIFKYA